MARTTSTDPKPTRAGTQMTAAQSIATETEKDTSEYITNSPEVAEASGEVASQTIATDVEGSEEQTTETTASVQSDTEFASGDGGAPAPSDTIAASTDPDTSDDAFATSTDSGTSAARPTNSQDAGQDFTIGTSDPLPSNGGPFIPGGPTGEEPTASIGDDNLDDLLGQMVSWNAVWDKPTVEIGGVETLVLKFAFPDSPANIPFFWQSVDGMTYIDENGEEVYSATAGFSLFEAFGADQIDGAMRAMGQWEDMTNVRFELAEPGETADVYFYGIDTDADWGATSNHQYDSEGSVFSNRIRVNINTNHWDNMDLGGSGINLLMHELGHTLGISHPGSYDVGDGATYNTHAEYIQDTEMYSIMSYFSGENTGANFISVDGDGIPNFGEILDTPRSHDIYVVQQLYGVNWQMRDGDSTYGYNASGVSDIFDFDVNQTPVLTIWDGGGEDWLDLSDSTLGVNLDLNPGAFSSTHGQTYNISIAYAPEGAPSGHEGYIENARGGSGIDLLIGNDVANILVGNGGNDTIRGGGGSDTLFGGAGQDTADFTHSNADFVINLGSALDNPATGDSQGTAVSNGVVDSLFDFENVLAGAGDDTITGTNGANEIYAGNGENVVHGLDGDDRLYGGADADRLYGGDDEDVLQGSAGDDRLYGGDDDDTLIGASGADRLYGGNHDDTLLGGADVDRLYGGAGVDTLEGHDGGDFLYGGADGDFLYGGDDNDRLYGGDGADDLFGDDHDDRLYGGDDTDSLFGGNDDDHLYGGAAYDYVSGGDGNDLLSGGTGDDTLSGGVGQDTASFTYSDDDWTVVLGLGSAISSAGESDELWSIENVRLGGGDDDAYGDGGANTLEGNDGNDILYGGSGDDGLYGGAGNDILNGGVGNDALVGGAGMDTASYATAASAVIVDLEVAGYQNTVGAGSDGLSQIENLEGSDHNDWLYGDDLGNQLYGGAGADVLAGRAGIDWLFGGDGDDYLLGGEDGDLYYGGAGSDTVSYHDAGNSVWVNLNTSGFQNTFGEGLELLSGIENVNGSAFGDILTGDGNHNQLSGNGGNDALIGGAGDDGLYGGAGNDQLYGGLGNDYLNGGTGNDWANYSTGLTSGVTVSLNLTSQFTGGAGVDTLTGIENLHGTQFGDSLIGDENANHLIGEGGADWLSGGNGNDELEGGNDNDILSGGAGNDELIGGSGNDLLVGGLGFDDFVFYGNRGDDTVTDFNVDQDDLDFSSVVGLNTIAQLTLTDTTDGVTVSFDGNSVTLNGVSSWQLSDDNFFI